MVWKWEHVSQDEFDDSVVRGLELRERELLAYETNIESYQHALDTAETEFERKHWAKLIVTENQQMSISRGFHRALKKHAEKDAARHEAAKVRVRAEAAQAKAEREATRALTIAAARNK